MKEFHALHDSLHDYADDALLAESDVTIDFESLDSERAHRIVIVGPEPGHAVLASWVVPARARGRLQFVAPPAGSYRMTSPGHPELEGEIRFADDGARAISIRVPESEHRFERLGVSGWSEVARRVADVSPTAPTTAAG